MEERITWYAYVCMVRVTVKENVSHFYLHDRIKEGTMYTHVEEMSVCGTWTCSRKRE